MPELKTIDHKIEKIFGQSLVFAGYSFIVIGTIGAYFNPASLLLVIIGIFIAFTYNGTIIDYNSERIKSYTCFFGLFKYGNWYPVSSFDKFRIYRSDRRYTTYSRANIPFTIKTSEVRLELINKSSSVKITVNRYDSFEEARKEMTDLIRDLHFSRVEEWVRQEGKC